MPETEVVVEPGEGASEVVAEIGELAEHLSYAFRSPEAVAKRLRDLIVERYPERVASAVWVTIQGEHDRGITIEVRELPLRLRLQTLWGIRTGGIGITRHLTQVGDTKVSVGAAAVAPYMDLARWEPALVLRVTW